MTADSLQDVGTTVETYHRIAEAFKHGFSVRSNLGDSDVEDQQFKDRIQEVCLTVKLAFRRVETISAYR